MKIMDKQEVRQELPKLSADNLAEASIEIENILQNWEVLNQVSKVAFYLAMKDEIDLEFLFNFSVELYLPRYLESQQVYEMAKVTSSKDLIKGKYGILEPKEDCPSALSNEINLWFIPGRAFDIYGNRLGRGGGFYDRLLEDENGIKVGVTTEDRILDYIPVDSWDIKMDFLITNKKIINIKEKD